MNNFPSASRTSLLCSFLATFGALYSDAAVGGRFLVVMRAGDQDMPHAGTYKTIDRPNRLAFTWESPFSSMEDSTVTIDFEEVDFVGSSGIGTFVETLKLLEAPIALVNVKSEFIKVFRLYNIQELNIFIEGQSI